MVPSKFLSDADKPVMVSDFADTLFPDAAVVMFTEVAPVELRTMLLEL